MALNDVPKAGQTLNETRNPINENFSLTNTGFAVDHQELNTANVGKHNKVTWRNQASSVPALPVIANELILYNNAGKLVLADTSAARDVTDAGGNFLSGFYNLWNGGLVVRYGQLTASGTTTVAFPTAFGGQPQLVQLTVDAGSSPNLAYWDQSTTTATVLGVKCVTPANAATSVTFYFMAVGPR